MTGLETQDRIDEQAAVWAARNALDDMAAADAFEAWLAADRRHQGAYLRAQAAYYVLEEAVLASPVPTPSNDDDNVPVTVPSRRRWPLAAGMTVAAGLALTIVVGAPGLLDRLSPSASRALTLADGSSVTLEADGKIASAMVGRVRSVTLEHGAATFHVAKDPRRPFIVRSGQVYAEATGTVYLVRRVGASGGAVSVSEGSVRVWAEGARHKAVILHAGNALTLDPAKFAAAAVRAEPARAPTEFWFDNTSIGEAAQRFNRVGGKQIIIADRAIGGVVIMGGFRSDRPEQFARAAATIAGARVVEHAGTLVIEKK